MNMKIDNCTYSSWKGCNLRGHHSDWACSKWGECQMIAFNSVVCWTLLLTFMYCCLHVVIACWSIRSCSRVASTSWEPSWRNLWSDLCLIWYYPGPSSTLSPLAYAQGCMMSSFSTGWWTHTSRLNTDWRQSTLVWVKQHNVKKNGGLWNCYKFISIMLTFLWPYFE